MSRWSGEDSMEKGQEWKGALQVVGGLLSSVKGFLMGIDKKSWN